jgi:hypothetical protein
MKLLFVALAFPVGVMAQGFTDPGPTCYSWNGGHKSAGSFTQCNPELQPAYVVMAPEPVVAVLPGCEARGAHHRVVLPAAGAQGAAPEEEAPQAQAGRG